MDLAHLAGCEPVGLLCEIIDRHAPPGHKIASVVRSPYHHTGARPVARICRAATRKHSLVVCV